MVCAVGIGVPRVKTVMYALFFWLKSCQQVQGYFSMGKVYETVNFDDLYKNVDELINNKKSFSVIGVGLKLGEAVTIIENAIGKAGMRSRVYTANRSIVATAGIVGGIAIGGIAFPLGVALVAGGVATAGTTAGHNLATINPDYEITKHPVKRQLTVTYKK